VLRVVTPNINSK